jgi:hypothetical protein
MHDSLSSLRHDIRGTLNALKLCISAFDMPLETSEKLEFLSDIEASAEKLEGLVAALESPVPPAQPISQTTTKPAATIAGGNVR